ncbi:MAG: GNAT family N-acetyltransferase [Oligoflexales bacterium]
MDFLIRRAEPSDIEELLKLYFIVYQNKYPLPLGTDPKVMLDLISRETNLWLVAVNPEKNKHLIASVVFEVDTFNKIGKLSGVVTHPDYRGKSLASKMIQLGSNQLLDPRSGLVDSVYTTTRTISKGPQVMCLNSGFRALGIFPNAHKLERHETLTLLAKHKEGVLQKRRFIDKIPEKLLPLYELTKDWGKHYQQPEVVHPTKKKIEHERRTPQEFEFIFAPKFVYSRFLERFSNPHDRFYPFHKPNMVICAGPTELYCYLSRQDRYCTIIGTTVPLSTLVGRIPLLLEKLSDYGASYIEALVGVDKIDAIHALLEFDFVPSAVYPAMRPEGDGYMDFVVMSHTMQPLNFAGMSVDSSFKPFIDQYVALWKQRHLDVLEVFKKNE